MKMYVPKRRFEANITNSELASGRGTTTTIGTGGDSKRLDEDGRRYRSCMHPLCQTYSECNTTLG